MSAGRGDRPKPPHLAADYAAQFRDEEVAAAYRHRPPYPAQTFALVEPLLGSRPRIVLELGAGTGDFTAGLAPPRCAPPWSPARARTPRSAVDRRHPLRLRSPRACVFRPSSRAGRLSWEALIAAEHSDITPHYQTRGQPSHAPSLPPIAPDREAALDPGALLARFGALHGRVAGPTQAARAP